MRILLHRADGNVAPWMEGFAQALPQAEVVVWQENAVIAPCDYAVLWSPPQAMLTDLAHVKAIFVTGAGVDGVAAAALALPAIPIIRLGDAGMAVQMAEYVLYAVLRYFRRFDEYQAQALAGQWRHLPQHAKHDFSIGVMGLGVMGARVLDALKPFGFPLRGWSRTPKKIDGVTTFAGEAGMAQFLRGSRVLVCLLPLTNATADLLDHTHLSLLPRGAFLINAGRGAHVVEADLLALIESGHVAGATLDVCRTEPLPEAHPFWREGRITLTPHMAALTLPHESALQMATKIAALERGDAVADVVDRDHGY